MPDAFLVERACSQPFCLKQKPETNVGHVTSATDRPIFHRGLINNMAFQHCLLSAATSKGVLAFLLVCTSSVFAHASGTKQLGAERSSTSGDAPSIKNESPVVAAARDTEPEAPLAMPLAVPLAASLDDQGAAQRTRRPATQRTNTTPPPTPQPQPTVTTITPAAQTAMQTNVPQSAQGRQYGQTGFVGEPINLNVVNADIRDILNYITEQYGVNFIIDKSVGPAPVTVNVTEVPWNVALDAILRANRLDIAVTGNILRVATSEVIATESSLQQAINDGRLNNAPLVTEFVRLNYARASGTLAGAAGSSGGFAGGTTGGSFSGGTGGDSTGGGGDQGILPIISRRLSRRGGVEVDGRSNTLIITDVKENIDA
ncbi:MAG: hypothetical protein H0T92_19780, partial [Pyrinomonadaceae bacterium]|nr:hypothetical protein [Pyrinomonadaceae bacterium]